MLSLIYAICWHPSVKPRNEAVVICNSYLDMNLKCEHSDDERRFCREIFAAMYEAVAGNITPTIGKKYAHVIMALQFLATREIMENGVICPSRAIAVAEDSIRMAYNALEYLGEDTKQDTEDFEYANAPVMERVCPNCQHQTKSKLMLDNAGSYTTCNYCYSLIEFD